MASTHVDLVVHVVFSTKYRQPWIDPVWRARLHAYLGGTVRGLNATPIEVGGIADHIHVLMALRATHCLADVMRDLKRASSQWIKVEIGISAFAWQDGYAAFSVCAEARDRVRKYIQDQDAHHRSQTPFEELKELLESAGVSYNSEYLE
jgi:putative transposase